MRFGILRCELGCLTVSRECVFRLFIFQQMRKRKPCAGLTFFGLTLLSLTFVRMARWFDRRSSAQELLSVGIIRAHEHQAQVEVRLKNIRLGIGGFAVSSDRFLSA